MKENLYYLFLSGVILGSGPCLSLCAPILMSYTAAYKQTIKKSISSYFIFSIGKLLSYAILGILCAFGAILIHSPIVIEYANWVYIGLGCFIILIGLTTIFYKEKKVTKICQWLHKGNIRNVGILGILVGLSPCLPLLGILNYIMMIVSYEASISYKILEAVIFSLVFGLGTVLSPLLLLVMLSAKLADKLTQNNRFKTIIRIICGFFLVILGGKITLQILLR